MILYHAISTYQLLEMVLYRLKESPKEESILMITDTLRDKFPNLDDYLEYFEEIWVYDINIPFPPKIAFQTVINSYFDNYFKEKGMLITDFEEIYAACVHYYFGNYLTAKEIPFVFFEDAAGMLSREDILINMEKDRRPFKCQKNIERGLYNGKNKLIKKVVCNVLAQEEGVCSVYDEIEDFNVVRELQMIDEEIRKRIMSLYLSIDKIEVNSKKSIILTQHFANLGILDFEQQIEIYQNFVDYFFKEKDILIKSHPDDIMYYSKILANTDRIKEKFPSEFLPLLINNNVSEITTISSTAIKNYYGCQYEIFELNTDFEKTFSSIHRYYVALRLCMQLTKTINTFCCDEKMIKGLIDRNEELNGLEICSDSKIALIDDYLDLRFTKVGKKYNESFLEEVETYLKDNKYDAIIFLNSRNYHSYFYKDESVFKNIFSIPIKLVKQKCEWWSYKENCDENLEQTIYLYTKNDKILQAIKRFNMVKKLENSKQTIEVQSLTEYERKAYEGQIKALEERLKYYISLHEGDEE